MEHARLWQIDCEVLWKDTRTLCESYGGSLSAIARLGFAAEFLKFGARGWNRRRGTNLTKCPYRE